MLLRRTQAYCVYVLNDRLVAVVAEMTASQKRPHVVGQTERAYGAIQVLYVLLLLFRLGYIFYVGFCVSRAYAYEYL